MRTLNKIRTLAKKIMPAGHDPLDGDDTDILAEAFKTELDHNFGNITNEEYSRFLESIERQITERRL